METDVAQVGRAQKRVADNVNEHVGIGVAEGAVGVGHHYAAEPEGQAFLELVNVVAEAGPDFHKQRMQAGHRGPAQKYPRPALLPCDGPKAGSQINNLISEYY
jgi:hypothetical protein